MSYLGLFHGVVKTDCDQDLKTLNIHITQLIHKFNQSLVIFKPCQTLAEICISNG